MSGTWYLSRAILRRDAEVQAIAPVLLPHDEDDRIGVSHRLIWSIFSGNGQGTRDFLWHEEEPGHYLLFSPQRPQPTSLFHIESKPFTHWPQSGDRLSFFLRVNPTASLAQQAVKANGKRKGGKRVDVIMQALHPVSGRAQTREPLGPRQGRAFLRDDLLGLVPEEDSVDPRRPVEDWLSRLAARSGFRAEGLRVTGYRRVSVKRDKGGGAKAVVFGQADVTGELTVTDADAFASRLKGGFGRAKAFGCGLMLLARGLH